ncbi:indole-3-glycerol-phosphate synthase [Gloeobacter kilaueensis JS1]|uniref:Indole-3-glycerol phosphate synthase n=1 Tax=Gloeobacter kilaueensis (strain ATCC BAA-2537 / CCAP 1431/1 / ULC 316 / JS1) TaxID=1183438 RepID=U5QKM6_GLOK1|nr:indole-3-glycerol-phosphate synthase [Gloeobacter kilaueensis JS1]
MWASYIKSSEATPVKIRRRPDLPPVAVGPLQFQLQGADAEPQNILEKIVWSKERELERQRELLPLARLRERAATAPPVRNFLGSLRRSPHPVALIAEVKQASPSRGVIRPDFDPVAIAHAYAAGGADALSVLTDEAFFAGSYDHLRAVRAAVDLPLLCKEFILSPYQVYQARAAGADAVLLIAAILENADLRYLLRAIEQLGMTALVEVHDHEELERVLQLEGVTLVGINNRNLLSFDVRLETTEKLLARSGAALEERGITLVSESGIYRSADLVRLRAAGARAALVGESLLRRSDLVLAVRQLLEGN